MKVVFNPDIQANLSVDENENVRTINHSREYWKSSKQNPLDVVIDYLQNVAEILKISKQALRNVRENVSYDEPLEQDVQYRLSEQKKFFDSTTVGFSQTFHNLPVWKGGITVTLKDNPYRVINTVNTSQKDFDAKLPPSDAIKRHKQLFHVISDKGRRNKRKRSSGKEKSKASIFIRDLINKKNLSKANEKIRDNSRPIRGRFFVYKYNQDDRLPKLEKEYSPERVNKDNERGFESTPILPLYPVGDKIKHGHYYVVDEITFSFTTVEYGAINWIALVELETRSVLYLRPLAAYVNGLVFKHNPISVSGNPIHAPNQSNEILNPFRSSEVLQNINPSAMGTQSLQGSRVTITDIEAPSISPPTNPTAVDFNYNTRTNDFAAVSAYYHTERFISLVESLGFPISSYFDETSFPIEVDHRGLGSAINAHCVGNGTGGIDHCCYGLGDITDTTNPVGRACDPYVHYHELGGHGILYEHVDSANFGFSHSAGDSIAAIVNDPDSIAPDRFLYTPWRPIRRFDRDVSAGWAWGGGANDDGGYGSEQILATCHFRIYRSIGGDSNDINRKRFASRLVTYLILRTVSNLTPMTNPSNWDPVAMVNVPGRGAQLWCEAMQAADLLNWTTEGVFGGAYNKVIRWSFERQGSYQPLGAPTPVTTAGAPPLVDVYIDDDRHGEYQYQPVHWDSTSIWNRRLADGLRGHQDPLLGSANYIYVTIKNRGTQTANNVKVRGYHSIAGAGLSLPTDIQSLTTSELPVGTVAGNNTEEKTVGPFEWIPEVNAYGYDSIFMIVSADNDASNLDNFTIGETIPDWRLVPNDNNIGQKNMYPFPGISQLRLTVRTGEKDIDDDDKVFLGFGGREFRCRLNNDSHANPFHIKNNTVTLVFGLGSNVEDSTINDPRNPLMDISDANEFPVYIRVQQKSKDWNIEYAAVETTPQTSIFSIKHAGITVGDDSGESVDLV
jgi:zinc metalloprotease ZmpB